MVSVKFSSAPLSLSVCNSFTEFVIPFLSFSWKIPFLFVHFPGKFSSYSWICNLRFSIPTFSLPRIILAWFLLLNHWPRPTISHGLIQCAFPWMVNGSSVLSMELFHNLLQMLILLSSAPGNATLTSLALGFWIQFPKKLQQAQFVPIPLLWSRMILKIDSLKVMDLKFSNWKRLWLLWIRVLFRSLNISPRWRLYGRNWVLTLP